MSKSKIVNIAEALVNIKNNPEFKETWKYQLPCILEEDVTDISFILEFEDTFED